MEVRSGLELVATLPNGESVVALTTFEGGVILATTRGAYIYREGSERFESIEFVRRPDPPKNLPNYAAGRAKDSELRDWLKA